MMGSKSDQFVHDLVQFYRNRGSHNTHSQQFVARLNGKIVNLLELYTNVLELGGSFKVNQLNQWDDIYCKLFKTSVTGANISVALRQIYSRFLLPYEKAFSSNFGNDLLDDEEDESNLFFANHSNFTVSSHQYQQSIYSNTVHDSIHPLNKLFCSILSQLPNELDFALKVSTILINSNRFDWSSDSKFIDLILESTIYYCCICDEENDIIGVNYNKCNGKMHSNEQNEMISWTCCCCYQRFWYQCCTNEHVLELVFDSTKTNFKHKEISSQHYSIVKERIKLIADLIRNLSFTYDSQSQDDVTINLCSTVSSTGGTTNMLKFLLLMMMCDEPSFNNIAFDILSNIAPATAIVNEDLQYSHLQQFLYRHCIFIAMTSNNIFSTVRSLEIVSKLLSTANEELISTLESYFIEYEIFSRITQLLTCHYEITLLLAILDFCLSISEQRPHLLVKDGNKYLIRLLLTLINCETSQHFTTCALKRIKIIDERPQVRAQANGGAVDSNSSQNTSHSTTQPNSQFNNSQSIIVDNETFALNWLRTTYEPITTNCIQSQSLKVSELYADYVKYCCRSSRRNVIAAQSFSQLIKRCFPSCSITNNSNLIEGIIVKSISNNTIQTKSNQTPPSQLASPILKAHLSAPPKNSNNSSTSNNNTNNNNKISNNSDLTNCNTVTLTPTTNTSTLIKSLLANKLRSNATISSPTPITQTKTLTNDTTTVITGTKESNNSCKSESPSIVVQQQHQPPQQPQQQQHQHQQQQSQVSQPPSITFTPTITFTTSNTIINASNATISTQALQQPAQQFLLVRTIITPTGQQQSGCSGITTTGTPVRLILPASMLTQQRLSNPTVNGITSTSTSINNATISTTNSINNNNNNTVSNNAGNTSSDLFLKTVLSGNNTSNSLSVSPMRSNVKSSPLLNVLLDKGKLPDFASSPSIINNQVNANAFGSLTNAANVNVIQQQAPKMYIITTKSPLAIKSLPSLQSQSVTQSVQQTTQTLPQQQMASNCSVVQQQNSIHSQQTSNFISNATLSNVQSFTLSTNLNSPNKTIQSSKICFPSQINGELGPTITTVPSIKANILNASDLSSIKDIKKTVDDATKLIAKRQTEEESINANKKLKLNSVLVNPITQCLASSQISVNHDSNTQQVLAKACSAAATTTITTATTSSSNLVNSVSNNTLCGEYECQWHECKKSFIRAAEVFLHVYNHHVMPSTFPDSMTCLWGGTEGTGPGCLSKRPKLSLLTHLLDFHCNQNILHQEVARKKQVASKGSTSIVLQQPPAHPGYAHNAALLAIRRHATNYVEMPTVPPVTQLTPLTVSIRLTAALILRNLAQHSSFVKRSLEYYEPVLCELSMADGRDESRTIAQCLALINERNIN